MDNLIKIFEFIKSNIAINDNPIHIKSAIDNHKELCSWEELEFVVNTPSISNVELIGNNNLKIDIPKKQSSAWHNNIHVNDHEFVVNQINNQSATLIVLNWEDHSVWSRDICKLLEQKFHVTSSAHIYCGIDAKSQSFKVHADDPCNFIFQIEGRTEWKVFENRVSGLENVREVTNRIYNESKDSDLKCVMHDILSPGDILYIPQRMYHMAKSLEKRISISFPCRSRNHSDILSNREFYKINY